MIRPQATTWYVDTSVPAAGDGLTPATAFKTISEATTVAQSGDTIRVAAGLYAEAASLYPGVEMIGAGWKERPEGSNFDGHTTIAPALAQDLTRCPLFDIIGWWHGNHI